MKPNRAKHKVKVCFTMQVPVNVSKQKGLWISKCPALDVYSQGPNEKEALANLLEALQLFLASCYQRGTLDQVLRECGFQPVADNPEDCGPEIGVPGEILNVPLPFVINEIQNCHA